MKIYIVNLEYEGTLAAFTNLDKAKEYTDEYSKTTGEGVSVEEYNSLTGKIVSYDVYNNHLMHD